MKPHIIIPPSPLPPVDPGALVLRPPLLPLPSKAPSPGTTSFPPPNPRDNNYDDDDIDFLVLYFMLWLLFMLRGLRNLVH